MTAAPSLRPPPDAPALLAHFAEALAAARAYEGATAPNPPVGCVLLDGDGAVLAQAAHVRAGAPHAEAAALAQCRADGTAERLRTALVTLEPCSHTGRTPPCVDALLASPVREVVVGALDPHPRAPGAGVAKLRAAGVGVTLVGDLPDPRAAELSHEAARLIAPFGKHARTGRPWVLVKTALDAGGSMIPPPGRKTFTSPASLAYAHRLRRASDAILTGSGCILADDPAFTVRLVADHPGKRRRLAVMDRRGRVAAAWLDAARERGLDPSVHADLGEALDALGAQGVLQALVEAGPTLRQAVLEADLWDEEVVFRRSAVEGQEDGVQTRLRAPLD